jgi:hypothetical protein
MSLSIGSKDTKSDDSFFNASFFAPSSEHEEEWKSSIKSSLAMTDRSKDNK